MLPVVLWKVARIKREYGAVKNMNRKNLIYPHKPHNISGAHLKFPSTTPTSQLVFVTIASRPSSIANINMRS